MGNVTDWAIKKLSDDSTLHVLDRTPEDLLLIKAKDDYSFVVAVVGVQPVIHLSDVKPFLRPSIQPLIIS
jgi:hypothetical protein